MTEDLLIDSRDRLLSFAHQYFASNIDVVGLFLSGSLAAGTADAYSDIDLRVVVKPEKHRWFVEHRRDIAQIGRISCSTNGVPVRSIACRISDSSLRSPFSTSARTD
jgi:hypothetical protein